MIWEARIGGYRRLTSSLELFQRRRSLCGIVWCWGIDECFGCISWKGI